MRRRRVTRLREITPLSLSFLDVMSCGLGAVVLIFLLIKHGETTNVNEIARLNQNTIEQVDAATRAKAEIMELAKKIQTTSGDIQRLDARARSLKSEIKETAAQNQKILSKSAALKAEVARLSKVPKPDPVKFVGDGERSYLIGIKVEGKRIALLLDASASMTATKLIDVIRIKNSSNAIKSNAPKWTRAKRVLTWLMARLPKGSRFQVLTFNTTVTNHSGTGSWVPSSNAHMINASKNGATSTVPTGGTNLEVAFKAAADLTPRVDSIYLVTDGFPTQPGPVGGLGLTRLQKCFRSWKSAKTVSGKCRSVYFEKAVKTLFSALPKVKLNVILLPMEGDPLAAAGYRFASAMSGGITLIPAQDWP